MPWRFLISAGRGRRRQRRRGTSPPTTLPKITPIRLIERATPFDDPNYLFELKYDGFRAVAYMGRGTTKLVSCRGNTYKRFDDLCAGIANTLKVKDAITDGEIVCLDEAGGLAVAPASSTVVRCLRSDVAERP